MSGITQTELIETNFSAIALKERGFNEIQLKAVGFDAEDLKAAGYNAVELRAAGFTPSELKEGGFTALQVSQAGFNLKRLRQAGFHALEVFEGLKALEINVSDEDFHNAGYSAQELHSIGRLAGHLRTAGYTLEELVSLYNPGELNRSGFSKEELKKHGVWAHDGEWRVYNQYWSCCYSTDRTSEYCAPLRVSEKMRLY